MTASADKALQKRIRGWMMFDFANQPFYTLMLTFIFGPYFASVAAEYYSGLGQETDQASASAQSIWFWGQAASGLFIAFAAPIVGAHADTTHSRMKWFWASALVYVLGTWALWYLTPDGAMLFVALAIFNVAFVASEFTLIFTNSMLPGLGPAKQVGKISGNGLALGYVGGILSLFIMLFFIAEGDNGKTLLNISPIFGLDPDMREGTRAVGPFTAIWFMVFIIPFALWVRDSKAPNRQGGMGQALRELRISLAGAVQRKSLFNFLIASMLYRDGLNALYAAGGLYAGLVLGWGVIEIGTFGIIAAFAAAIITYIGGFADRHFGPKPVIQTNVIVLIIVTTAMIGVNRHYFFGIPLVPESTLPDIMLYVCGAAIGGAGGVLYSASRTMMVRHTNPDRPTEGFGLFALSGKATAFLAPMSIALVTWLTGNTQIGFTPVIALLVAGLFLLRYVKPNGDQA